MTSPCLGQLNIQAIKDQTQIIRYDHLVWDSLVWSNIQATKEQTQIRYDPPPTPLGQLGFGVVFSLL